MPGPSQSDVLRERFGQVPWRRALIDAVSERLGRGPTAIPDRIEGAVYGQLIAEARASGRDPSPAGVATAQRDVVIRSLSIATELRRHPVAATIARFAEDAGALGDAARGVEPPIEPAVAVLHALVIRRLISGERDRRRVLHASLADLARAGIDAAGASADRWHRSAWDAFAGVGRLEDAIERAPHEPLAALMAGGLAGAYWGGEAIPTAWRRSIAGPTDARRRADRLIEAEPTGAEGRRWSSSSSDPLVVDEVPIDLRGAGPTAGALGGGDPPGTSRPRGVGRLGICALPGRRYIAYHTGAHWRDLDTDCSRLRALGYDTLLLLVEDRELMRCRVTGIGEALAAEGIELIRHPIRDPLVPRDGPRFRRTIESTLERLRAGRSVAVACRGGLDRSGMAAACVLRQSGLHASRAIDQVQASRPGALRLPDQQAYVRAWPPSGPG